MPSLRTYMATGLLAMCASTAHAKWFEDMADPQMKTPQPQIHEVQDALPEAIALESRQNQQQNNTIIGGNIDMAKWNSDTTKACGDALGKLTAATNPSGTSVCYNLLSLDSAGTGKFMADLRLFQVSTATGDFAGVSASNVAARVSYSGASVMLVSDNAAGASAANSELKLVRRQNAQTPVLIRTYMIAGTIDPDKVAAKVDKGRLESWITPSVSLAATNLLGQQVTTKVTSNEAIFVNGIFAGDVVLSDVARAQLAVDDAMVALRNGTAAFVVPGVNILIQPIGLWIMIVWLVVGFGVYGFGTFERYKHRDAYRRRTARANDNMRRI